MDAVRSAIEAGQLRPNHVARLRQVIRAALVEDGQPVRDSDDSGSGGGDR
ncbi:MAG TPA: hypothetical protein HA263_06495 [Methanoregulaceae archaeon]|nr:hypothetical protein [Methanoregulaceae archaeon]